MNLMLNRLENMKKQSIFEIRRKDTLKQKKSTYIFKVDSNTFLIASSLIDFLKESEIKTLKVTLDEVSKFIEVKLEKDYEFMGMYNPNFPKLVS